MSDTNYKAITIIQNAQIVQKIADEAQRQEKAEMYIDYGIRNDCLPYIWKAVKQEHEKDSYVPKVKYRFTRASGIANWLISELFRTFDDGFEVVYPESVTKKQKEMIDQLLEDVQFKTVLKDIDRHVGCVSDLPVFPIVNPNKKQIKIKIKTPDLCSVVQDEFDPTEMDYFMYYKEPSTNTSISDNLYKAIIYDQDGVAYEIELDSNYSYSSEQIISMIDKKATIIDDSIEFGKMPVVMFRDYIPIDTFWTEKENKIIQFGFAVDKKLLHYETNFNTQCSTWVETDSAGGDAKFGQLLIVNLKSDKSSPNQATADYKTPDHKVKELLDALIEEIRQFAYQIGMSDDTISGKTATSGFHLFMSMQKIYKKSVDRRSFYENSMKQLIQILTIAAEKSGFQQYTGLKALNDKQTSQITFKWENKSYPKTPKEIEEEFTLQKANNMNSEVERIMKEENITDAEAIEKLEKRKEYLALTKPAVENPIQGEPQFNF